MTRINEYSSLQNTTQSLSFEKTSETLKNKDGDLAIQEVDLKEVMEAYTDRIKEAILE